MIPEETADNSRRIKKFFPKRIQKACFATTESNVLRRSGLIIAHTVFAVSFINTGSHHVLWAHRTPSSAGMPPFRVRGPLMACQPQLCQQQCPRRQQRMEHAVETTRASDLSTKLSTRAMPKFGGTTKLLEGR